MISFITGSEGKYREVKAILPDIEKLSIDLPEIQSLDPQEIIRAKLLAAFDHSEGEFIVEDTSLHLECLGGLPGPMIKWFIEALGSRGIAEVVGRMDDDAAIARSVIGYAKDKDNILFFEGVQRGRIVKPEVPTDFGWNNIFVPEGYDVTFEEMPIEEKNKISMRGIAARKLKEYLDTQN